jgi:hypothetical protein
VKVKVSPSQRHTATVSDLAFSVATAVQTEAQTIESLKKSPSLGHRYLVLCEGRELDLAGGLSVIRDGDVLFLEEVPDEKLKAPRFSVKEVSECSPCGIASAVGKNVSPIPEQGDAESAGHNPQRSSTECPRASPAHEVSSESTAGFALLLRRLEIVERSLFGQHRIEVRKPSGDAQGDRSSCEEEGAAVDVPNSFMKLVAARHAAGVDSYAVNGGVAQKERYGELHYFQDDNFDVHRYEFDLLTPEEQQQKIDHFKSRAAKIDELVRWMERRRKASASLEPSGTANTIDSVATPSKVKLKYISLDRWNGGSQLSLSV